MGEAWNRVRKRLAPARCCSRHQAKERRRTNAGSTVGSGRLCRFLDGRRKEYERTSYTGCVFLPSFLPLLLCCLLLHLLPPYSSDSVGAILPFCCFVVVGCLVSCVLCPCVSRVLCVVAVRMIEGPQSPSPSPSSSAIRYPPNRRPTDRPSSSTSPPLPPLHHTSFHFTLHTSPTIVAFLPSSLPPSTHSVSHSLSLSLYDPLLDEHIEPDTNICAIR